MLTEAWDRITAPDLRPYLWLFGQLHDLASDRTPWTEFRADHQRTTDGLRAIAKVLTLQPRLRWPAVRRCRFPI